MVFQRIYSVQDDFFSSWSNDMAYVLGWIYSDGTLRKGTNATRIASTDYEILDLIKSLISWSGSIKAYPDPRRCKQCYEMMFSSKQIRQDLDRLGLVPNKSNIVTFPIVPIPSLSHFIRGYLDGNGSIYIDKPCKNSSYKRLRCSFSCGSKKFLESLQQQLVNVLKIKPTKIYEQHIKRHGGWLLQYSTYTTIKVLTYLYQNAGDKKLERKYKVFNNFLETFKMQRPR